METNWKCSSCGLINPDNIKTCRRCKSNEGTTREIQKIQPSTETEEVVDFISPRCPDCRSTLVDPYKPLSNINNPISFIFSLLLILTCVGILIILMMPKQFKCRKCGKIFTFTDDQEKIGFIKQRKYKYEKALEQLKANPTNADLKQQCLELGRNYSAATRDSRHVTLIDELSIMNDINSVITTPSLETQQPAAASTKDRLKKLEELKNQGLINESEFNERRNKILNEI